MRKYLIALLLIVTISCSGTTTDSDNGITPNDTTSTTEPETGLSDNDTTKSDSLLHDTTLFVDSTDLILSDSVDTILADSIDTTIVEKPDTSLVQEPKLIVVKKIYEIEVGGDFIASRDIEFSAMDSNGNNASSKVICIEYINTDVVGDYAVLFRYEGLTDSVTVTVIDASKLNIVINASIEDNGNVWITLTNKELKKEFKGLEFRVYIPTTITIGTFSYWDIQPFQYFYNGMIDPSVAPVTKEFVTSTDYNCIKVSMDSVFVIQPLGIIKMKLDIEQFDGISYEEMITGWSFREHKDKSLPYYRGIGAAASAPSESAIVRTAPDPWAGELILLPTEYIAVYQNGKLIYGNSPE